MKKRKKIRTDKFSIILSGVDMDCDYVKTTLSEFENIFEIKRGSPKKGIAQKLHKLSILEFDLGSNLLEALGRLEILKDLLLAANIDELTVHSDMSREFQFNGELSADEIKKLDCIGANYTWTIEG